MSRPTDSQADTAAAGAAITSRDSAAWLQAITATVAADISVIVALIFSVDAPAK
jgi:hypothetical protein